MKKFFSLKIFTFAIIFAFALFSVSCDKSDDAILPNNSEDAQLKAGHLPGKAVKKGDQTIVEIALGLAGDLEDPDGEFNELVKTLLAVDDALGTELVATLNGTDQFTVFAPTDAAFFALYDVAADLGIDLTPELVLDVLLYHVTYGRRAANSVVPKNKPRMIETLLEGASFKVDNQKVIWAVGNTANIVTPNISASNGIIHVIDAVILPIELP